MEPIVLIIALTALIIATITDLKTQEVPDWLSYGLITTGFALAIINSIQHNITYLLNSIYGFILALIIGFTMYFTGQWGGGDSKLLFGLGALIGFNLKLEFFPIFLIAILFAGAVYGIIYAIALAIKNRKNLKLQHNKRIRFLSFILSTIILLFYLTLKQTELILLALISFSSYYIFIFLKSLESSIMIKTIKTEKLTEGDWIVNEIKVNDIIITGPKDLGITKEKINLLKQHNINEVTIKQGIPFVPSFLIAFIVTIFYQTQITEFMHLMARLG